MPEKPDLDAIIAKMKQDFKPKPKAPPRAHPGQPYPGHPFVPQTPITSLLLIVHEQRCKNCGHAERYSNRHLLASYAPPAPKGVSSYYTGVVPADVPLRKEIWRDFQVDFCEHCFCVEQPDNVVELYDAGAQKAR